MSLPLVVAANVLVLAIDSWRCPMIEPARFKGEQRDTFESLLLLWLAWHDKLNVGAV